MVTADALAVGEAEVGQPTVLAANLPYNVAVPVLLNLLAALPSLDRGIVMVQAEVADRMCAGPGSRVYGAPSAKLAWYASARSAGNVPRTVFWPMPNVDSKLVAFTRHAPPPTTASRAEVFAVDRRRLRPAPQDPAGGPGRLGRIPGGGRTRCCARPGWTRARAARRSRSTTSPASPRPATTHRRPPTSRIT